MVKKNNQGELIIISGPSGVGKGTIIDRIIKGRKDYWLSTSVTTRPMRANDIEGVTYHFISNEKFEEMIKNNEFLEYEKGLHDQSYGTPKAPVLECLNKGINVILEIDVKGAINVTKLYPQAISIFILPPSMNELKKRLEARGTETQVQIYKRIKTAYTEIKAIANYKYLVENRNLDDAVKSVEAIVTAEKHRSYNISELSIDILNLPNEFLPEPFKDSNSKVFTLSIPN